MNEVTLAQELERTGKLLEEVTDYNLIETSIGNARIFSGHLIGQDVC